METPIQEYSAKEKGMVKVYTKHLLLLYSANSLMIIWKGSVLLLLKTETSMKATQNLESLMDGGSTLTLMELSMRVISIVDRCGVSAKFTTLQETKLKVTKERFLRGSSQVLEPSFTRME